MAHHIYHTRGIILGSGPSGESNRYYKIFTEELGLVHAVAQSVREGRSKLRYVLQDYSIIFVDLVRGKEVWRITSAGEHEAQNFANGTEQKKLFAHIASFVERLLQGEGREDLLFADLLSVFLFLKTEQIPRELFSAVEILGTFRALVFLGYIDGVGYEEFLMPGEYSINRIMAFESIRPTVLHLVGAALTASHL